MLPTSWTLLERGALDGAGPAVLRQAAPQGTEAFYVTQLRSGEKIRVRRSLLQRLLQEKIEALEQAGADSVVVFCTGEFDPFDARVPVYESSRLLKEAVAGAYRGRPVGIVVPEAGQIPALSRRWTEAGVTHVMKTCSPYGPSAESEEVCRAFAAAELDFIVLDCVGFSRSFADLFREKTGKPVLLPRELICRAVSEDREA